MKVDDLLKRFEWEQIPNTNGRFTLRQKEIQLSVESLIDSEEVEIKQYPSAHPQELIHVVELEDGGLISYERKDATYIHTLNSQNMFKKKQWELGIIKFSPRQIPDDNLDRI
tara:strand:+ start:55337 stop:55672 length:336 start_codon:yes stop_codon:yes gene_type:complete